MPFTSVSTALKLNFRLRSDIEQMEAQMVRLRERIAHLENAANDSQIADKTELRSQIDALEEQVAILRGRVEELERKLPS